LGERQVTNEEFWSFFFAAVFQRAALPQGSMRVAPGSDALVWRTTPARDEPQIVMGDSPDWHAKGL
jgi:hypothetical protein